MTGIVAGMRRAVNGKISAHKIAWTLTYQVNAPETDGSMTKELCAWATKRQSGFYSLYAYSKRELTPRVTPTLHSCVKGNDTSVLLPRRVFLHLIKWVRLLISTLLFFGIF